MYRHAVTVEAGSWFRVDTASGSSTPTSVFRPDGVTAVSNRFGGSGSTVRNETPQGQAVFLSTVQTLYVKRLTYQGALSGDTPITSTGRDLTIPPARDPDATYAPKLGAMTMAGAVLGRRHLDRWIEEAFDPPATEDTPTITYTTSQTTAFTGTPVLKKPAIVGLGSSQTGWDGQSDTVFRFGSGRYNTANGGSNDLALYGSNKPGGNGQAARWPVFVTFETGADVIELLHYALTTTDVPMIRVEGRWLTDTVPTRSGAVGNQYMSTLTFPSQKVRRITLVGSGNIGLTGVRVAQGQGIWKPRGSVTRRVAIIGDSFVHGAGGAPTGAQDRETFAMRLAHLMGADDTIQAGIGGTGWVAGVDTGNGNVPNNYATRLSMVLGMNPHAIVFYGSINDGTAGTGVQAAAEACLAQCTTVPEVYTIGPLLPGYEATATAVAAGTATYGRQYIDLATFINGTGNTTSPNGTGNADLWKRSDLHPTFEAHKAIARQIFRGVTRVF